MLSTTEEYVAMYGVILNYCPDESSTGGTGYPYFFHHFVQLNELIEKEVDNTCAARGNALPGQTVASLNSFSFEELSSPAVSTPCMFFDHLQLW